MDRVIAQAVAAETLRRVAEKLNLRGVGGALIAEKWDFTLYPTLVFVGDLWPDPDLVEYKGGDHTAGALSKLAEMLSTWVDSGSPQIIGTTRESRGGLTRVIGGRLCLFTFFDGGTPDQNVEVALAALNILNDVFNAYLPEHLFSE